MVMAVDHGHAQLRADLIELITEIGHLVCTVLITCDDLVDRIDDDGNVILLGSPADEHGRQFIHGPGLAS